MKILAIMLACCACLNVHAQMNLVRNGSFEQYNVCPGTFSQLKLANYWSCTDSDFVSSFDPSLGDENCTPAFAHTCSSFADANVPLNIRYYGWPHSGNGLAIAMMYHNDTPTAAPNYTREYAMGRLYGTLTAGQSYCVTFYVRRSNRGNMGSYAIDHIGAYLDDGSIDTVALCGRPHTYLTPQVYTTTIVTDTGAWTQIQGTFTANGTEKYITIGNFADTATTNKIRFGLYYASWYVLDDVSVLPTSGVADAGPDTTIIGGDTARIGVQDSSGDGVPCYWYELGSVTPIDSGGTVLVHPADTTTYVVQLNLCGSVTYDTVTVNVLHCGAVNAGYAETGSSLVRNYTYTGTTAYMDSVRWDLGDGTQSTALNPVHTYTAGGTYHVCVTVYTRCGSDSTCSEVTVGNVVVSAVACKGEPAVWPNPTFDELHIDGAALWEAVVTDIAGRVVYRQVLATDSEVVDLRGLEQGVYMVQVQGDGGRYVRRVVKE